MTLYLRKAQILYALLITPAYELLVLLLFVWLNYAVPGLCSTTDRSPASAGLHLKCADVLLALNRPTAALKFTRKAADLRPHWAEVSRLRFNST
jgi:hypothetical protein